MRRPIFEPDTLLLRFDPQGDALRPWVVARNQTFRDDVFTFTVPQGFRTDLASIPRWLSWTYDPLGRHQRAAVFHDAAYGLQVCSRYQADALFRAILEHDAVPTWRAWLLYAAVRVFGDRAWSRAHGVRHAIRKDFNQRCE